MMLAHDKALEGATQAAATWRHCRNSIRIARLLAFDGGSPQLVDTACEMAMECACRALLQIHGARYEGGLASSLTRMSAPQTLVERVYDRGMPSERMMLAEKIVAWAADSLRARCPGTSWGF